MISETSPEQLEEYLSECLDFLEALTGTPAMLYLGLETKAKLEITLVNVLSVSQLKVAMSCLRTTTSAKLVNISSNLLATTCAKEQAESPLMFALLSFQARQGQCQSFQPTQASNASMCFAHFINQQPQASKQYALSTNQAQLYAQMH